jgi:MFS superfamily sulfate permease-like transporter
MQNSNTELLTEVNAPGAWKADLSAGFSVFLIALPLSIGIAVASNVPATAGLIAAIIGGILGSFFPATSVTINGPAAGLIAVVLACVSELGGGDALLGFRRTLAVTVVAGICQILLGFVRAGSLAKFFPSAVIHGMLASIGIIIVSKQIHVLLGVVPHSGNPLALLGEIPASVGHLNLLIATIGILSLFVLTGIARAKGSWTRFLPAPLLVAAIGVALGAFFDLEHAHIVRLLSHDFQVGPGYLLNIPANLSSNPAAALFRPDFSIIFSAVSIRMIITVCLVASIESVLSAAAVDKLDPWKRASKPNLELIAKGCCNTLCGLIGGLPIISEIVRSSANVRFGARTRKANFFHGLFILAALLLIPALLHRIPLAALAAILVMVGVRLASPAEFKHQFQLGWDRFFVFCLTIFVTLTTDLLVGVLVGFAADRVIAVLRRGAVAIARRGEATARPEAHVAVRGKFAFPETSTSPSAVATATAKAEVPSSSSDS